jgi:hypothetical protein
MPDEAPGNPGGAHLEGVLLVRAFDASGLLRERPLLYSASGSSTELQQHDYQYWTDTPPRMLQDQLVAYLRRSGIADSVVTPDLRTAADFEVIGKVERLELLDKSSRRRRRGSSWPCCAPPTTCWSSSTPMRSRRAATGTIMRSPSPR